MSDNVIGKNDRDHPSRTSVQQTRTHTTHMKTFCRREKGYVRSSRIEANKVHCSLTNSHCTHAIYKKQIQKQFILPQHLDGRSVQSINTALNQFTKVSSVPFRYKMCAHTRVQFLHPKCSQSERFHGQAVAIHSAKHNRFLFLCA